MTKRTQVLSASLALVLVCGVLTGCSTDDAANGVARSSNSATSASPTNSSTPGSNTSATSSTNPTSQSQSASTTAATTSSSPSASGASRPGSSPTVKWSPPSAEEQAKAIAELTALGYHVKFDDPSSFPAKPPVPPEPSISEDALAQTELGAILTVDYYIRSISHHLAGGSDTGVNQFTATSCVECTSMTDTINALLRDGSYSVPPVIEVSNLRVVKTVSNSVLELDGDMQFPSVKFFNAGKGKTVSTPSRSGTWTFQLAWSDVGRWAITSAGPKE